MYCSVRAIEVLREVPKRVRNQYRAEIRPMLTCLGSSQGSSQILLEMTDFRWGGRWGVPDFRVIGLGQTNGLGIE